MDLGGLASEGNTHSLLEQSCASKPMHRRLKAAIEAATYAHLRLKATAVIIGGVDFASTLERAVERSAPRLIETEPSGSS
jgi:hypothetical protein